MKWMFKLLLLGATLWGGYWFIGAKAQEEAYASLIESSRATGWKVESQAPELIGFPNRFDTTLTDLDFQSPGGNWGWRGESFQIKALSYQPNHVIAVWPGEHVLLTPGGNASINSDQLRASVVFSAKNNLPLERLQLEGTGIALVGNPQWTANIGILNGALFQNETTATRYRLGIVLANITAPSNLTSLLGAALPGLISEIRLSAQLDFDREIDRHGFESGTPPKPVHAVIEPSQIIWGDSTLTIEGELSAANNGYIEGHLSFDVLGWQPLYDVFAEASTMSPTNKLTLKRALDGASNGQNLVFTVYFSNGEASIGPFTIGPAPIYPF